MHLLKNLEVRQWLKRNPYEHLQVPPLRKQLEDAYGRSISNDNSCRWPSTLSKHIFKEYLTNQHKEITCGKFYQLHTGKRIKVDFETKHIMYKIYCRTWNTQNTKKNILITPYEYLELPIISNKELYIILMARQEIDDYGVFSKSHHALKKGNYMINWSTSGIIFNKFTSLV
jgi:hypothetical protein